jgi:hypothetical protein
VCDDYKLSHSCLERRFVENMLRIFFVHFFVTIVQALCVLRMMQKNR